MVSNAQIDTVQLPCAEIGRGEQVNVTIEEVNRVLKVGRLLFSVLTEEEIAELQRVLNGPSVETEIGNTGVT